MTLYICFIAASYFIEENYVSFNDPIRSDISEFRYYYYYFKIQRFQIRSFCFFISLYCFYLFVCLVYICNNFKWLLSRKWFVSYFSWLEMMVIKIDDKTSKLDKHKIYWLGNLFAWFETKQKRKEKGEERELKSL